MNSEFPVTNSRNAKQSVKLMIIYSIRDEGAIESLMWTDSEAEIRKFYFTLITCVIVVHANSYDCSSIK